MRLRNLIKAIVDLPSVTHEDNEVQLSTGQEVKELWLRGDGAVIIEVEEIKQNKNHEDSTMLREANSALRSNLEKCMSYYRLELMKNSTPNYEPRNSSIFMGFQELLESSNQEPAQCKDEHNKNSEVQG